ncbi:MAG TPA: MBL fold metallo-hydrolase [Geminicoccaceae bacterium]|nr:MBL fold metallo-hydrolase [Geminicoccaceae bacterium]
MTNVHHVPGVGRRGVLAGLAGGGATTVASLAGAAPAQAQSVAWKQPGNNNHVLELQSAGDAASGEVGLEFWGHCAFRLTSPRGLTMLVDPWRNDPSGAWGLWFPKEFSMPVADIALSTHTHFDHDAVDRVQATMVLDRMVGSYGFADVQITGVADKHACMAPGWYKWTDALAEFGQQACPPNNPGHMDMVTYLVEAGGMRLLFWGDNRHNPPEEVWQRWGRVDVLTLPVDGSQHILSYGQGDAIVERLKPKVVIPTHYLCEGTSLTLSTLQTADEWVDTQKSRKRLGEPSLRLHADEIAGMDREFLYFGGHVAKA